MHEVNIDKNELLSIVRENRSKHEREYNEAVEDYKVAVLKIAKQNLKLAKTANLDKFKDFESRPAAPKNYLNDYDRAIRMLELSVDAQITLQEHEFNQLVLDEWSWKAQFSVSNATYKSYVS